MTLFLSKLNLLIVDGVDVLNRHMTLLETAWNGPTYCSCDLVLLVRRRTRFRLEGLED